MLIKAFGLIIITLLWSCAPLKGAYNDTKDFLSERVETEKPVNEYRLRRKVEGNQTFIENHQRHSSKGYQNANKHFGYRSYPIWREPADGSY